MLGFFLSIGLSGPLTMEAVLVGGLLGYLVLLGAGPHETTAAYADLRPSIAALSNDVLLPSLAVALVSDLLSMVGRTSKRGQGAADPRRRSSRVCGSPSQLEPGPDIRKS